MPSITRSWISFHFALAAGLEASLWRITSARLNGTPAASRLDSSRVKFSSSRPDTLADRLRNDKRASDAGSAKPVPFSAAAFSARLTGRRPSPAICAKAPCRSVASIWPSAIAPFACNPLYWKRGILVPAWGCAGGNGFLVGGLRRGIPRGALDLFGGRHAQHFCDGGNAHAHQPPAVVGQGLHASLSGSVPDQVTRGILENQLPDR